jgi:hypothetical protein
VNTTTVGIHLLFVGVPALLSAALAALIWMEKNPHPATYKMSDPWTHEPILWTAVDEPLGGHHGGHGSDSFSVGGGASGTW